MILPLVMLSINAICSAKRVGWWRAIWATANPILMLFVVAPMAAANEMNKSDLIAAMAEKAGVSNKDAGACLDAMFDVVADAVAAGNEKVTVPGWISFEQTIRKARQGRNPQTGEAISIPATKAVKVSAGSKLKAAAKSGGPPMGM